MEKKKSKIKIKNLVITGGLHSKIIAKRALTIAPYVFYTAFGISAISNFMDGQTLLKDDLKYYAKIEQTTNDNNEVFASVEYVHPNEVDKDDEKSIITVTYPWVKNNDIYEREVNQYSFDSKDFFIINDVMNNKEKALYVKNELEKINSKMQTASQIGDNNEVGYEINIVGYDKNDYIIAKETNKENELAFTLSLLAILASNTIGHNLFSKDFNKKSKARIKEIKREIALLKEEPVKEEKINQFIKK
jgi:hypothetical protein